MAAFIITYDLRQSGQNYDDLISEIKRYGTWCHVQGSVWVIVSNDTAVSIRDNLMSVIDQNDTVFVCGLTRNSAWTGLSAEISGWLQDNL